MSLESTAKYIHYIAGQYGFYSGLFNLTIGIIGNTFLILIFMNLRLFRGNQCSFYLTKESFSNIGLLIAIYSSYIVKHVSVYDPVLTSLPWCKIRTMLAQTCGLCSVYTICWTAFDQYLSTNHRYSFRQISTLKLAHRLTIFNVCFCFLHSILFLIFCEIHISMGCTVYQSEIKKYFSFFYYPILGNALPLIMTTSFSLLAYLNVRRIIRRQVPIVRRRLDRQLTAMVLARVICLLICGLPFISVQLYQLNLNNNEENYMELAIADLIGFIFSSLLYTNFSITFYLFLVISSRFRHQVKHFLSKQYCRLLHIWHEMIRRRNPNLNRVIPEIIQGPISIVESVN